MFDELDVINSGHALDGPMQMALDEVLLFRVRRPTLRVYRWEAPCVTFGYFQPHAVVEELHPALPAVRRWTGGGIVVHGEDLTFSLLLPPGDPVACFAPSLFYHRLHGSVAGFLGARLAGEGEISHGPSCFSAPSRDDLMIGRRKVLGGAVRRSGGALLYQGSLRYHHGDQVLFGGGVAENLATALSLKQSTGILGDDDISSARELSLGRYSAESWNRRR